MKILPDGTPEYRVVIDWEGGEHSYLFRGGPLHNPEDCQAATQAIGFAIAQWARLETHIDAAIFQLNRVEFYPGCEWVDGRPPAVFPDKLKLLRRLIRHHPATRHMIDDVLSFTRHLKVLADIRNSIAHSVLEEITPLEDGDMELRFNAFKIERRTGYAKLREHQLSLKALAQFSLNVDTLSFRFTGVTARLFSQDMLRQFREHAAQTPAPTSRKGGHDRHTR